MNTATHARKSVRIWFWIITGIFSAFMLFSAIPDVLMTPEAKAFMNSLGYPDYIIPFIGVAKMLGILAILLPGFPLLKEWAYAGLFFDLAGASYSVSAIQGLSPSILFMLLPLAFLFLSYWLHHRRQLQPVVTSV